MHIFCIFCGFIHVYIFYFSLECGSNLRTEPKFIVFISQLLMLFKFCHSCKADGPLLQTRQVGTEIVVTSICINPKCPKKEFTWYSQPVIPNSKMPAGNFLLCMAILLAGGSASKVFQIFRHMGLGCVSLNTFFNNQKVNLLLNKYIFHSTMLFIFKMKQSLNKYESNNNNRTTNGAIQVI